MPSSPIRSGLYYQIQRYKFESNSQLPHNIVIRFNGCITRYKDTNLKAIHNDGTMEQYATRLYYQIQRYKFESNSQLVLSMRKNHQRCITRYKDTNLKAIHNRLNGVPLRIRLYYQIQRYKFESNSQPKGLHSHWQKVVLLDTKIQI